MTDREKKQREILELVWGTAIAQHHGKLTSYGKYSIDQALAELDAYYKSKVPKKLKGHTFTTMKHIPDDSVIWTGYRQGYNQCVDDFHKEVL